MRLRPRLFFPFLALALAACAGEAPPTGSVISGNDNPLLAEWHTEFGVPPFDLIKNEHYLPAFREAMAAHKAEVQAVIDSFGMDKSKTQIFYCQSGVRTTTGMFALEGEPDTIIEAFKPGTGPADSLSIIGMDGYAPPEEILRDSPQANQAVTSGSGGLF